MNTIQEVLTHLENYNLAEAFALLDSLELQSGDKPVYARLKKEFIAGKDDVDYLDRLRIFIQNLDEDLKPKPKDSSQNEGSGNITIMSADINQGQMNIGTTNSTLINAHPQNNTNNIKSQVKELLADIRLKQALNILFEELKDKDERLWDEVIQCKARLKRLELDRPSLSSQEANREERQIIDRIFWIVGELD